MRCPRCGTVLTDDDLIKDDLLHYMCSNENCKYENRKDENCENEGSNRRTQFEVIQDDEVSFPSNEIFQGNLSITKYYRKKYIT